MNKNCEESADFIVNFQNKSLDKHQVQVIICPAAVSLHRMYSEIYRNTIQLGGQNMYFESVGAFTGEISGDMLKTSGAKWVILGHSERRHIFGESNRTINKKVLKALQIGLNPILCIGETQQERESGKTKEILYTQITDGLSQVKLTDYSGFVMAYEPVWAIGTGLTASAEKIEAAHQNIREIMNQIGFDGSSISILYGGSVKPSNASELRNVPGVDGFLVGGAALNVDAFYKIYQSF